MNRRDLSIFFGLEIFAIFWAGLVFNVFESRLLAGSLAGSYFVILGTYILFRISKWQGARRALTLYPALIHVFIVSIPMLLVRWLNASQAFTEVRIWGLEGPTFHRLSTTIFSLLIIATILDWFRAKPKPKSN